MKETELLAPGGSFLSAYYAFEAGADGVYLGLKEFSARKGAQNFTREQLRRIRQLAADRNRRLYVTVNTVIQQGELARLHETLSWCEALSVDGVIVQDLGVYSLLHRYFPRIPIHASTQMAVHNDAGLRMAEDMGIRRVILSRELPLERIRELRARHPGIELEVFIHGALCYSFSGVCLASWALTGRSGNRGDCAQICRSLFRGDFTAEGARGRGAGDEAGARGGRPASGSDAGCYPFSCRDLFLGREALALAEIGIDGLKIEGRMKSPEYVANVTRLYRAILDRGAARYSEGGRRLAQRDAGSPALPEEEYEELARKARLGFAREPTTGWFRAPKGVRLISSAYPGHRGVSLGTVAARRGGEVTVKLSGDLSLHDGLGFFPPGRSEPVIFSVARIRAAGREVKFARKGETVSVEVPSDAAALPDVGAEIRHLSSRFLDLPQPKEAGFPLYKIPVNMDVTLARSASGGGELSVRAESFPHFMATVTVEAAAIQRPFIQILTDLLNETGDSLFRPGLVLFTNGTDFTDDGIFVPPSQLKKAKNGLYALMDESFTRRIGEGRAGEGAPSAPAVARAPSPLAPAELDALSHRELIMPPRSAPIPFVTGAPSAIAPEDLPLHAGFRWLALPPVIVEPDAWREALQRLVKAHGETRFAIGLNNLSHIGLAAALADQTNAWFFADFYLYMANAHALSFVCSRVPRLLFAYAWLEGDEGNAADLAEAAGDLPIVRMSADFRPPLFYSMGCFARYALNGGECFDGCPRDFTREVWQGKNRFSVVVRDCVTYLFRDEVTPARSSG